MEHVVALASFDEKNLWKICYKSLTKVNLTWLIYVTYELQNDDPVISLKYT